MDRPEPDQLIQTALSDPSPLVRSRAITALGNLGEHAPVEILVKMLLDANSEVRLAAVTALGNLGEHAPLEPLISALHDEDSDVRSAAVTALGNLGEHAPLEPLISALRDEDSDVRSAAVTALGNLGEHAPLEPLISALHDKDSDVRSAAVTALGNLGKSISPEILLTALQDSSSAVRSATVAVIKKLSDSVPQDVYQAALHEEERYLASSNNAHTTTPSEIAPFDVSAQQREQLKIVGRLIADAPGEMDLLRFSEYADALVDFIKSDKTVKPLTIAIDASWGMGKTTLMQMIRKRLSGELDDDASQRQTAFPTVWFDAWKYDQEASLWAALALQILDQLRHPKHATLEWKVRFWWNLTWKRLSKDLPLKLLLTSLPYFIALIVIGIIIYAIAMLWHGNEIINSIKSIFLPIVGIIGSLTVVYATFKETYTKFIKPFEQRIAQYVREPNYRERIGFLATFEEDFQTVVEAATDDGKTSLIIFIDDLDRCVPAKVVEIIEAINLLLDNKFCVFVIGMDIRIVGSSIEAKYRELQGYLNTAANPSDLTLGESFLEKIVQIPFHIPRANTTLLQAFIRGTLLSPLENAQPRKGVLGTQILNGKERKEGSPLNSTFAKIEQDPAISSSSFTEQPSKDIEPTSFEESKEVRDAIGEAIPYLELNPRKIKRFINMFRLQAYIANRRGLLEKETVRLSLLAKWIVIVTRWPIFVEAVIKDQTFIQRLRRAYTIEEDLKRIRQSFTLPGEKQESQSDQADVAEVLSEREEKKEEERREQVIKYYQNQLDGYTEDPYIKRLIKDAVLSHLMKDIENVSLSLLSLGMSYPLLSASLRKSYRPKRVYTQAGATPHE